MKTIQHYQKINEIRELSAINNPFRGWYHIYSFKVNEACPEIEWQWCLADSESLVLLIMDLSYYRCESLDLKALQNIRKAFEFFIGHNKDLILRFTYDTVGAAYNNEPEDIKLIKKHMTQISAVLTAYGKYIFCVQGLFVGNWGEMHGGSYTNDECLSKLWKHWSRLVPSDVFAAVRTPRQWRGLKSGKKKLGLFNDGITGSDTDLGTYLQGRLHSELLFQHELCQSVPNGGELIYGSNNADAAFVTDRLDKMCISYLNSTYDDKAIEGLKGQMYGDISAFEYIGRRLGYCFVIKELDYNPVNGCMEVEISNEGFACFYFRNEVYLESDNSFSLKTSIDLRDINPGQCKAYKIRLKKSMIHSEYKLKAVCLKNGKAVNFFR